MGPLCCFRMILCEAKRLPILPIHRILPHHSQVQPYNEAPSRKRVNAKLEETKSKRLKGEGEEDSKRALAEGKVGGSRCVAPQ